MKVGIRQKILIEALEKGSLAAIAENVQSEITVMAMLNKCIRITVNKNFIVESSTDLLSVKYSIPVTEQNGIIVKEEGSVLVPAKELILWAKVQGPDSTISLTLNKLPVPDVINTFDGEVNDNQDLSKFMIKRIGTVKLISKDTSKTSGKWELDCFDPTHMVAIDYDQKAEKYFEMQGGQLTEALENVSFAALSKDDKHVWDAIDIQTYANDLYFAATDKARCALYKVPKENVIDVKSDKPLLAPSVILSQITKIINKTEQLIFAYNEETEKIFISQPNLKIRMVSTEKEQISKFPSIQKLVDKDYKQLAEISKALFIDMLINASVVNNSAALFIFNKTDGTFTVKAISEKNKYKPNIKQANIPNIAQDAKLVWAVNHLMEGLKVFKSEEVNLLIPENLKTVKITGKNHDEALVYFSMGIQTNAHYNADSEN